MTWAILVLRDVCHKYILHRGFLERRNAEDLQGFVEIAVEFECTSRHRLVVTGI